MRTLLAAAALARGDYHIDVSSLKTMIKGTFHGAIKGTHLQGYLDEYAFRNNKPFHPRDPRKLSGGRYRQLADTHIGLSDFS